MNKKQDSTRALNTSLDSIPKNEKQHRQKTAVNKGETKTATKNADSFSIVVASLDSFSFMVLRG